MLSRNPSQEEVSFTLTSVCLQKLYILVQQKGSHELHTFKMDLSMNHYNGSSPETQNNQDLE